MGSRGRMKGGNDGLLIFIVIIFLLIVILDESLDFKMIRYVFLCFCLKG